MKKYITYGAVAISVVVLLVGGLRSNKGKTVVTSQSKVQSSIKGTEHLTKDSFKEKICECAIDQPESEAEWKYKGVIPAVIDFYADWCGPCKVVAPILEELSEEYEGRVKIYKVNTEHQRELAGIFGIRSIPSILFIPVDGQPTMAAGALPKQEFKKIFREVLGVEEQLSMR